MQPHVVELTSPPSPAEALTALHDWQDVILFESALSGGRLGRYSFLTAEPLETFEVPRARHGEDVFAAVRQFLNDRPFETVEGLPPFQGGAAGFLGYEFGQCFERILRPDNDAFQLPDAWIGVYSWTIAWDHEQGRAWMVAQPMDGENPEERAIATDTLVRRVLDALEVTPSGTNPDRASRGKAGDEAKQYPLPGHSRVASDFTPEGYQQSVRRVIEYIRAGDIFQANLSQRLMTRWDDTACDLYQELRRCNPAPFAGYLAHDDWAIVSASPERFVRIEGDGVETRPIKGTRQRRSVPEADLFTRDELRESEKDTAENVMIVDLLRNDLSRVCQPGSISVPQLCVVETYETVQHLVSEIRGRLAPGEDAWSLLAASFPGGSITGAPKVRAMEIIAELEPTVRGPYCGSLFYAGFNGSFDSSILIRTFVLRHGMVQCKAGGGIVAQSDPLAEYEETLHKAAGMLRVFE